MTTLLYSPASPYSAKVRMAATLANVPFEGKVVDSNVGPPELVDNNPLGKIPVLLTEHGPVFDSAVIVQYLNRISGNSLLPRNAAKRLEAERLEALCDGVCDALLAHVYERRFRPEDIIHQPWLDRQWSKVARCLDHLVANTPKLPKKLTAGHLAMRAMLGYLDLRFAGQWERGRAKLKRWAAKFDERHPELAAFVPKA